MATKTISLELDAYEKLRAAKRGGESFSSVVRRAIIPGRARNGAEVLAYLRSEGPFFKDEELDAMEAAAACDLPPINPWEEPTSRVIIDTNILIRLERETRKGFAGTATEFFESLTDTRICVTPTIAGEIACGASMSGREVWEKFLKPFELVPIDAETTWHYGVQYRELARRGELIGTNDLWIAATALAYQLPLATGNSREFERVSGLEVVAI